MMNRKAAYKSLEDITILQEKELRKTLEYVALNSPFYKRLFEDHGIDVKDIHGLSDLKKLPLTTKDDLQRFNTDFFCVERSRIIDYVTTSGTLGEPVMMGLTEKDLQRLAYNEALSLVCSGVSSETVIQLMTTMDRRFMAGLAYFLGARELGAGIVRVGSGIPELQWDSILKFKPDYLICVPSFLLKLIEYAGENSIDPAKTSVKAAICIGEPVSSESLEPNGLAKKIKSEWDIELFSTYASTEMATAFNDCEYHRGGHLHPELILCELLDEEGNEVADGKVGELTITTLGVEGMPLVRFKTGDMLQIYREACECGRNSPRLGPVIGRKQQMIKYKGTTLYPPAIYNVLGDFKEIEHFVVEVFHSEVGTDEILLKLAIETPTEKLIEDIKDHFRAKLRVRPNVEIVPAPELKKLLYPPMSRKPRYLIDKRN